MMFWWFVLLLAVLTKQERLIPWIPEQVVTLVDIVNKRLTVDWDIDFNHALTAYCYLLTFIVEKLPCGLE
jgi:hypothetical protein